MINTTPIPIIIEDQFFSDVSNPPLARNHSQQVLTDTLKLYATLAKLDSSLSISSASQFFKVASNHNNLTLESMLDSLRKIVLSESAIATPEGEREILWNKITSLESSATFQALTGKVKLVAPPTSASEARSDLGLFLSLYYLTPFALKTDGSIAAYVQLTIANPDLTTQFKDDKLLTPEQRANGAANFSDQYLADRAALLKWVLKSNANDTFGRAEGLEAIYEDKASGINLSPIIVSNTPMVKFGASDADAIAGSNQADHLYGGGGDDILTGGAGDNQIKLAIDTNGISLDFSQVYTSRISKCLPQASAYLRKVASEGECLRLPSDASTRAKAGCETPIRLATSAWVSPALCRASSNTSNAANSSLSASHSARKSGFFKSCANAVLWSSGTGLYGKFQISSLTPTGCLITLSMFNLLQTFTRQQQICHRGFRCFFNKHMQNHNSFLYQSTKQSSSNTIAPMGAYFKQTVAHRPRVWQTQIWAMLDNTRSNITVRSQNISRPAIHFSLQTGVKIINAVHASNYNNHVINKQAANDNKWSLAA